VIQLAVSMELDGFCRFIGVAVVVVTSWAGISFGPWWWVGVGVGRRVVGAFWLLVF
jgi:hypothetical protein